MSSMFPARRALIGAGAVALLLTATACGGGQPNAGAVEPGAETYQVGYFPLVHTATAVHAGEAGIFKDKGLDVELVQTSGGAATIPALVSGSLDIAYGNYTSSMLAVHQGLPLVLISGNDVGAEDHGIFVNKGSDISGIADMKGKKFAVNNLQTIGTVAMNALLEDAGLKAGDVDFIEMPLPDMQGALEKGIADAIWQVEPFQASAKAAGFTKIGNLFDGPVKEMPVAGWVTTKKFADEHPEAIAAFQDSIKASAKDLQGNREELVRLVPTYTKVSAEVVRAVDLPNFTGELDLEGLQKTADLMERDGIIKAPLDVSTMIATR